MSHAKSPLPALPTGGFTHLDGEEVYRISSFHLLPPFMMSIPGDADQWIFVTSGGGLTAGRVSSEQAIFPYVTVDKLHDAPHHTGPVTVVRVRGEGGRETVWEPFTRHGLERFSLERNLYRNVTGNRLTFEEINRDLGLVFRYRWSSCEAFGLVRTSTLLNQGSRALDVQILDGFRNVLPWGIPQSLQQASSSLADAYKHTDLDPDTGMGIFSLTATILDRPEPAESLRANVVWCAGLPESDPALSLDALEAFRRGSTLPGETPLTGRRGNYFVRAALRLDPGDVRRWHLVADVGRSHVEVEALRSEIRETARIEARIESCLEEARNELIRNVASADGVQRTADTVASSHHFANVLFNNLRGGVFAHVHEVPLADLREYLAIRNRGAAGRHAGSFEGPEPRIPVEDLVSRASDTGDADLERLALEFLPLYFGRRHGDPSRPWNRFNIRVRRPDGSRALLFEGNWRDIFQNWEALAYSHPQFLPGMIARFLNASTVDGFNPYRITQEGVDWEIIDPKDPWSYIGYWGDHQVIYLLKLLEASERFLPGRLGNMLDRRIFSYAAVPYRIKPYRDILADPRETIVFDTREESRIEERVAAMGTDGKLRLDREGGVIHVSLLEKLVVPALSKLSNLIPGYGIWMNTQRPEWNDANNALVGWGVSVVTLGYLRRYMVFLRDLIAEMEPASIPVTRDVVDWFRDVHAALDAGATHLRKGAGDTERRALMDALGEAFSRYRERVYEGDLAETAPLVREELLAWCRVSLEHLDDALGRNRRDDGLYNSYCLLRTSVEATEATCTPLQEMLEGQVSALSSGSVGPEAAVGLLDGLFESRLYREDANSFLLYPDRELPTFLQRNRVPGDRVQAVELLVNLLDAGERSILGRDTGGLYRFHGDFRNARDLEEALDRLEARAEWAPQVRRDRAAVLALFEEVFDHHAFTGRSGTMYAYEGLGSIYWHMVAKLLLAVQEIVIQADENGAPQRVRDALIERYYRVRAGLGFEKTVSEYGAFPIDPYSHSPRHAGAQQPGMTGQVKEEILTRLGELGIRVEHGVLGFRPVLLRPSEFLSEAASMPVVDASGSLRRITVPAGALAFTFCGVPVLYHATRNESWVRVFNGGKEGVHRPGSVLDAAESAKVFARRGGISRIEVGVPATDLCRLERRAPGLAATAAGRPSS